MTAQEFAVEILSHLPFNPNEQQMQTALALARFCAPDVTGQNADRAFLLNGYAGTGKTSLTGALVKALNTMRIGVVLLAPTGRAAKVFAASASMPASTIHRRIYRHALPGAMTATIGPRENTAKNTIFIVDEASMIASEAADTGSDILSDLIHFVYSSEGCRLIFTGDTAQLPPIGQPVSPAMNPDTLRGYGLKLTCVTLTDVRRQSGISGILANATRLRKALYRPSEDAVKFLVSGYEDVEIITGEDLPDRLDTLYQQSSPEETLVITRSNRSATLYNQGIRAQVLGREEELTPGDLFIAVKNNYTWGQKTKNGNFVANGEALRLVKVIGTEIKYGLRFADVILEFTDTDSKPFEAKIILSPLSGNSPALDPETSRMLYAGVYNDPELNPPGTGHLERLARLRKSPYFNALQVKYAYAVTCHKAQGGQWDNVLIDLSYLPPEQAGGELYRWLYTAVTRARKRLILINPPELLVE